ncbi:hypothetical protein NM688_g4803 [Phlebia brevispora]|uniref:Uncharacterized protein n=1 Tax=Phlebia brevispora TaxID=194682 RepID=A0ACC1T1L9_9APHY|nr:hypothetical protein NM688_g4803 [Phlebia brevispora]
MPHEGNTKVLAQALSLHRDPSRGRTHIVIRQVEYVPTTSSGKEKDIRDRFNVIRASVFRIADVLGDIETALNLNKGEGREYIDGMLAELDSLEAPGELVPIFDLTLGEDIEAWLGNIGMRGDALRTLEHDPDWRKRFNKNGPPAEPLKLASGAQDAEFDF